MQLKPLKTEKALKQAQTNRYTFGVDRLATKTAIKQAVTKQFAVEVAAVRTQVVPGNWKKAVVMVKSGHKIDLWDDKKD